MLSRCIGKLFHMSKLLDKFNFQEGFYLGADPFKQIVVQGQFEEGFYLGPVPYEQTVGRILFS